MPEGKISSDLNSIVSVQHMKVFYTKPCVSVGCSPDMQLGIVYQTF